MKFNFEQIPSLIHSDTLKKDIKSMLLEGFDKPLNKRQIDILLEENSAKVAMFLALVLCADERGRVFFDKKEKMVFEIKNFLDKNNEYVTDILKQMIDFKELNQEINILQKKFKKEG